MLQLICESEDTQEIIKIQYSLSVLLSIVGIRNDNNFNIYYGTNQIDSNIDIVILKRINQIESEIVKELPNQIVVEDDILLKSFILLTCKEEYNCQKDKKGRFLSINSRLNNFSKPMVNYYANILKTAVEIAARKKNIQLKIASRKFTVMLSHDVDNITDKNIYVTLHRLKDSINFFKNKDFKRCFREIFLLVRCLISRDNNYWDFEQYIEMEKSYGFKSSFYFINGEKGRYGARYKLKGVHNIIKKIDSLGWEVGLHTNYFSYNDPLKIKRERNAIESVLGKGVIGARNHYLRFNVQETWRILAEAGIKYDSTLGYSDSLGFRAGIAYPFYPFDLNRNEVINIIEIPMVIMDGIVLDKSVDIEDAWSKIKIILDETKKINGTISINFHNGYLFDKEYPGWRVIYIRILEYIKQNEGIGITGKDIYNRTIQSPVFFPKTESINKIYKQYIV